MIEHLATVAAQAGKHRLSLFTIRETGNIPVFEKLGFRVVHESLDSFAESDRFPELHEAYMERDYS